ncbi:MAG: AAA family ATPase, partial [Parachlamydiaceae bacterium]|nr:AAA family ATPase [Parachlamydiaceae bacterium]
MLTLKDYVNLKLIQEGRRNVIYSAMRVSDGLPVILKIIRGTNPKAEDIALIYHEFELCKDLDLPGVIKTYAIIEDECYALVQESIQGISLEEYIKQQSHPNKNLSTFYKIAMQMVKSIGEIHRQRIIHKDIKPSNFIIDPTTLTVKLTDFNFAVKLLHEVQDVIPPERLVGTLAYMAPEQTGRMNMNVDYRSDFYALGVSFYELLTGDIPFHAADPFEMVHAHIAVPAPSALELNPDIPESLGEMLLKLMSKNPSDRYQSTMGILEDLKLVAQPNQKPFILGQKDVYDCLNISQKLYGRKDEIKFLLAAYDRVSQGAVEALMVSGYSGIGKTMLINEVHKPMVKHKGYFISGKFNRLQRDTPYTAIIQALNQLARIILSEPETRFEALKEAIIDALGGVAQVMIDLAPMLELVIGPQPPLEKMPPRETQNRMMIFFKRFIRVIASKDHPLVLFIDDLQWVDSSSLKLLEYIITDEDLSHVLLIGAYRDNEVDSHHPLQQFFIEMEEQEKKIHLLPLGPLKRVDFEALFKDSFNREEAVIRPLAEFVHKCTGGNSFFCKQVINSLYDEKFLFFDYEQRRWDWDLEKIKTLKITDNVVELLLVKLNELPIETLTLLRYAACIGNSFAVEILRLTTGSSANEINKNLEPALQNELIQLQHSRYKVIDSGTSERTPEVTYQFVHDRVQQAVDQGISQDERQKIHLSIARLLFEKEPEACRNEFLFEVTDHFNQSHGLLKDTEKMLVVKLNYQAGLKALGANAYNSMTNYLHAGLTLTDADWWKADYELMFALKRAYAESLYLTGVTDESVVLTNDLLQRAQNTFDKASIYRIQSLQSHMSGNIVLAVDTGLMALELLGVKIPKLPSKISVWKKFMQIKCALWRYKLETLEKELKVLSDKNILAAFQILNDIFYSAYSVPGNMYTYLLLESMHIMLQHGKPPSAGLWVTGYALAVLNLTQNVSECFTLWDLAERLMEQEKDKYSSPYSYWVMGYFLNHLRHPFKETRVYCQRGIRDALESGNLQAAIINMGAMAGIIRGEAKSLVKLRENQEETLNYARKIHMKELVGATEFVASLADVELGRVQPGDEPLKLYRQLLGKGRLQETIRSMHMGRYFHYLELYETASEYHFRWFVEERRLRYNVNTLSQKTLDGLSIAKCIPDLPFLKKMRYRFRLHKLYRDLKWAAEECPSNYQHQFELLKGVQSSLRGRHEEAIRAFEKAAEVAKKSGGYLWVGIANELAGDLLIKHGFPRYAIDYIQEAHYYYERYCLKLKVDTLEKRYPHCFVNRMEVFGIWGEMDKASTMSTTSSDLDISSVIKASQSISEELVLENLFAKVLHIMIENAGAQKALFIERVKKQWQVTASLIHQKEGSQFQIHNVLLNDFKEVPHLVINSSLRTKEPIIINNPKADSQYAEDLYVNSVAPKSILCLPIVYKDKQVGLIYLENNLTAGAFTEKRIHLLRTLSTQIVISLENARHFEHVEFMYRAMERFVPKRFLQLLQREHVEDVKLGDSVKCKISALFADIRGFTTLAETLTPERTALLLNTYMRYMAPIIRKNKGFVNQFLGDGIMALFPESPSDAVDAAVAMNEMLASFNKKIETQGFAPISVGIGINTGDAMICALGEEERLDASVVSDAINTASRVEGLNKYYKTRLLISEAVFKQLPQPEKYLIRLVDRVFLKGKRQATGVYEVSSLPAWELLVVEREYIKSFSEAFVLYERGNFSEAKAIFRLCQEEKPGDYVVELLLNRCISYIASGIP